MRDGVEAGARVPRTRAALTLVTLLVPALALPVSAQDDPTRGSVYADPVPAPPQPLRIWAAYGAGSPFVTNDGDPEGGSHTWRVGIGRGDNALVIQYGRVDAAFGPGTPGVSDVGALWARSWGLGPLRGTGAVGLSRLSGFECVSDDEDPNTCDGTGTFAFPAYAQLDWQPVPVLGVGVFFSTTVSPDGNWGSIGVIGQIGKVR